MLRVGLEIKHQHITTNTVDILEHWPVRLEHIFHSLKSSDIELGPSLTSQTIEFVIIGRDNIEPCLIICMIPYQY